MTKSASPAKKPRKSAKQATFDRQVFHVRRLLRESGAVETKPPGRFTGELAKMVVDGDEWLLPTAYGPADVTCYASVYDGSLWVAISLRFYKLAERFGVHHKHNQHFDKDHGPVEVQGAIHFKLNRLCNRQTINGILKPTDAELSQAEAAYIKEETDRKTAWTALLAAENKPAE